MSGTLLIAGGGYADVPLILAAQKLGYRVITSGNRVEDAGHALSDQYCPADFSDPEAMLAIAQEQKISAISANCNDFSALSSAFVAESLGLKGHDHFDTCQLIHHKDQFRSYAARKGLPCPGARHFDQPEAACNFLDKAQGSMIIKPVDLTGGKGVQQVSAGNQNLDAVNHAFEASKAGRIVIEDFIDGSNHGFSCIIRKGRVVFHFSDNEHYFLNPYLVSGASTPGILPPAALDQLIDVTEFMADDLRLVDGIFHVQFILREGEAVIIEICRRPPGDLYIELVRHATGLDYSSWLIRAAAGLNLDDLEPLPVRGFWGRHCIMASQNGLSKGIEVEPSVKTDIFEWISLHSEGQSIDSYLTDKLGIVFLSFSSQDDMMNKMRNMPELIKVQMS